MSYVFPPDALGSGIIALRASRPGCYRSAPALYAFVRSSADPTACLEPPNGGDWIHEIKHDGFRILLATEGGRTRAFTRNGYDWTGRYAPMVKACEKLSSRSALIDGKGEARLVRAG